MWRLENFIRALWNKLTGKTLAMEMIQRFEDEFPGRCVICSYHKYGVTHGLTSGPVPEHDCIEKRSE